METISHISPILFLSLCLVVEPLLGSPQVPPSNEQANSQADSRAVGKRNDQVSDTVRTLPTSLGTVDVHESINSKEIFYVAPRFRFLLVAPEKEVIARPARDAEEGTVPVQMSIEMVHPQIRDELKARLIRDIPGIQSPEVRNLQVDSVRVGVAAKEDRELFGVEDFVWSNPPPSAEYLPITLSVLANKARQFAEAVNQGRINFKVTYSYNQISVDDRIEMLRASMLMDTEQIRDLEQRGAEIMTASQMAEAAANVKREVESKVIEGIGKIEPQSLPIERLVDLFSVGETWKKGEQELADLDRRLIEQFDLGVDPKDFQPFRYQKKVTETLAKEVDTQSKKKAYFDLYEQEKTTMGVSGGFGIGPFSASANLGKEFEESMKKGEMSDEEFRDHLKKYHGVEFNTEMVLERGVELYDLQKVRSQGELRLVSVTVKPTLGTSLRNLPLTPNLNDAVHVERLFAGVEDRLTAIEQNMQLLEKLSITVKSIELQLNNKDEILITEPSNIATTHVAATIEWAHTSTHPTVALRIPNGESHFAVFSDEKTRTIAVIAGMMDWRVDFFTSGVQNNHWQDVKITGIRKR